MTSGRLELQYIWFLAQVMDTNNMIETQLGDDSGTSTSDITLERVAQIRDAVAKKQLECGYVHSRAYFSGSEVQQLEQLYQVGEAEDICLGAYCWTIPYNNKVYFIE